MAILSSYLLVQSGTDTEKEIVTLPAQVFLCILTHKTVNFDMLSIILNYITLSNLLGTSKLEAFK